MKKLFFLLALLSAALLGAAQPDSSWSIVISGKGSDAEKYFDRIAAELLRKGVKHLTGADLKIVTGTKRTGKAIFVGRNADPVKLENGLWQGRFRTDKEGNWYFAGSFRSIFHMAKHTNHRFHEAGIIRCAALFLREYAGFRAYLPGGRYQSFTAKKSVDFPKNFVKNYQTPAISYCNGRNTGDPVYDLANGFLPGVWYFTYGGHSHPVAVPLSVYKEHPEYFILTKKGKRWQGKQYCISNPGFQELVYKEMCRKVDEGYQWVQLAQTDGFGLCRCKNCQEYGNTKDAGEKIWILHRKLAERFHKERPGKKVVILCYHPNVKPPKAFSKFPPNVIIETSRYKEKDFKEWSNTEVPGGFVTYVYNWGTYHPAGYSPKFLPEEGVEQLKVFRKYKVRGVYRCGFGELFGLEAPSYYAYGAALSDPRITADEAVMEFCRGVMPNAPQTLKNFYDKLYAVLRKDTGAAYTNWHQIFSKRMPGGYKNHRLYVARYDEKSLAELDVLLKKCEAADSGNKFPLLLRREFDLVRHTARMSRAYLSYLKSPDFPGLQRLEKAVNARTGYLKSLPLYKGKRYSHVGGQALFAQHPPQTVIAGGSGSGRFVYPVTWPWKKLMSRKIVPGARTVRPDGKEHYLLPGLMEKWEEDVKFKFELTEKGVQLTTEGLAYDKKASDFFYIHLPDYRIIFRCGFSKGGVRAAGIYRNLPGGTPVQEKTEHIKSDRSVHVKRTGERSYTVLLPWRYFPGKVRPQPGSSLSFNVSFRRQVGHNFRQYTFEPDLKHLGERTTWMAGRGKLLF